MSFSVSLAQTCNYNGICESGEDSTTCVYDCLISTSHKNIKIQNATYNLTKVIHYKLDGSKEEITNLANIKDFLINNIDFSILGVIGAAGNYKLYDLTDNIPVIGYRDPAICNPNDLSADEWQAYNQHENWFVHQSGEPIAAENRVYRKWAPGFHYLYNPVTEWIEEFTGRTGLYLNNEPGFDGVFLDDTIGWVNTSQYVWHKTEEQYLQEYVDENHRFKYLDTNEPIYSYENFPAIVSSLSDPTLIYDYIGIWGEIQRIYFDYIMPVAAGTVVNVSYYTDATILQEIQDTWKQRMIEVLGKTREKIGGNLIIYNGFSVTRDYDNDFLQIADGGMFEGLFHNGWTPINENISESYWKQQVEKLFDIAHTKKKIFLAQTNAVIDENTTEAQIKKLAMFSFASFLLGKGDYAYYGFNVFPGDGASNQFIYFDYWKTDIGEALEDYHLRESSGGANIYEREFENVLVLVNPSESSATVNLGGSYKQLTGGVVSSVVLDSKSGVILYKPSPTTTTTIAASTIPGTTTTTGATSSTPGGGGGGGGGASTTVISTTSTPGVISTSTTSAVSSVPKSTTTTTLLPGECLNNSDCDDGKLCSGIEVCEAGKCVPGTLPCGEGDVCRELSGNYQCWTAVTIKGQNIPQSISRPLVLDKQQRWILVMSTENDHFTSSSSITIAGLDENARGVTFDSTRKSFKLKRYFAEGSFILIPVVIDKLATTGTWTVNIIIKDPLAAPPMEKTIISTFQLT
jgi:hypothetical protein